MVPPLNNVRLDIPHPRAAAYLGLLGILVLSWANDRLEAETRTAIRGIILSTHTDGTDWSAALRRIFSTRGKARKALEQLDLADVRSRVGQLVWGEGNVATRFQGFAEGLPALSDNIRRDLASELLHFTDPEKNWLWTERSVMKHSP